MTKHELKNISDDIIAHLPENVTWDDFMQQIYVRQKIETGLNDAKKGNLFTTEQVRNKFKTECLQDFINSSVMYINLQFL